MTPPIAFDHTVLRHGRTAETLSHTHQLLCAPNGHAQLVALYHALRDHPDAPRLQSRLRVAVVTDCVMSPRRAIDTATHELLATLEVARHTSASRLVRERLKPRVFPTTTARLERAQAVELSDVQRLCTRYVECLPPTHPAPWSAAWLTTALTAMLALEPGELRRHGLVPLPFLLLELQTRADPAAVGRTWVWTMGRWVTWQGSRTLTAQWAAVWHRLGVYPLRHLIPLRKAARQRLTSEPPERLTRTMADALAAVRVVVPRTHTPR